METFAVTGVPLPAPVAAPTAAAEEVASEAKELLPEASRSREASRGCIYRTRVGSSVTASRRTCSGNRSVSARIVSGFSCWDFFVIPL